ncbi:MAG: ComF family protein [Candidatus Binatia bacterium]
MRGWSTIVADVLFPRECAACAGALPIGHASTLCSPCWTSLRMPFDSLCPRCGIPTPPVSMICAACSAHPPAFDSARALGLYLASGAHLNPLAAAVRALKYRGERAVARCLGRALAERCTAAADLLVVPVPLHPSRLRERGYNQAALLAAALASTWRRPVALRALTRVRATPSQAGLDAHTRRTNLRDAFAVHRGNAIAGRTIALVDDVLTTGATADACATALRHAGAASVVVYTVGRTP